MTKINSDALNACRMTVSSIGFAQRRGYRKSNALYALSLPPFNRKMRTYYERKMLDAISQNLDRYQQFVNGTLPIDDTPVIWTFQKFNLPPKVVTAIVDGKTVEFRRSTKFGEG